MVSVLFLSNLFKTLFNICMKSKILLAIFIPLLFTLAACPFSFGDNDEWKENMQKYEAVITHMADNMKIAIDTYQPVWDEAEKLGL